MLGHFVIISPLMSAAHPVRLRLPRMQYIDITLYDIYIEPRYCGEENIIKLSQEIIEIFRKMNGLIWIFFFNIVFLLLLLGFFPSFRSNFEGELLHFNVIVSYTSTRLNDVCMSFFLKIYRHCALPGKYI